MLMKENTLYKVISFNYLTSLRQIPQEVDYTTVVFMFNMLKYIYCVNISYSYIIDTFRSLMMHDISSKQI